MALQSLAKEIVVVNERDGILIGRSRQQSWNDLKQKIEERGRKRLAKQMIS